MESTIIISVETKFRKITEKDFDNEGDDDYELTKQVEEDFHYAISKIIHRLAEDTDFEFDVFEEMDNDCIPPKVKSFSDLGEINIRIRG